ncbi:MAG: mercury methylation corrinoid protein HgcA [Methanocorpusculum sp.]|uniref:mercury methylation corrinoid protein HgcA n=1 Tax=Methanocorpusculum sp. TaxID=2058474 RepID=UPI00271A6B32|nr:mercury methylation corrinoid protein HgcA [Methanocorpusculum sp.]MDO9522444.1 mercury methylation corrinoid protein HgcA [Methanocorpusculum sp.]
MTEENNTSIFETKKKTITGTQTCGCADNCCETPAIQTTTSKIIFADRLDHLLARLGWNRLNHSVEPGLYRLGDPDAESPVFASANYTLSFDALRSSLAGIDAWILVLDTKGINVWCAAGKGTFGTDELVHRIESTGLAGIVSHRKIIVPQLGAPGVFWPEVVQRTKFIVEYGPVRANDLPEYLKTHTATPDMRCVKFSLRDRLVLTPVEFMHFALPTVAISAALWFLAGPFAALAAVSAVLSGTVLFPLLLPVIPTRDFSTKGMILGVIVSLPFAYVFGTTPGLPMWAGALSAVAALLLIPAVIAYLALNFTGCSTFTSRMGVKKEIFSYVKVMAGMAAVGVISGIILGVSKIMGVI